MTHRRTSEIVNRNENLGHELPLEAIVTPQLIVDRMMRFMNELDKAQRELEFALRAEPDAEFEYRQEKGKSWMAVIGRFGEDRKYTADFKEAIVNAETAELRQTRDKAVAHVKAMMEKVRNERQKLSALQSAANAIREEAALARVGPEVTT